MGILFPLVVPIVCSLAPEDEKSDLAVQTSAAILSSCIFGNCENYSNRELIIPLLPSHSLSSVMSPLADLTVLTRVSTQCDINSHLRTASVCHLSLLLCPSLSLSYTTTSIIIFSSSSSSSSSSSLSCMFYWLVCWQCCLVLFQWVQAGTHGMWAGS